jgi:protein-tyrosine sulfotransferase
MPAPRPVFLLSNFRTGSTMLRYVLDTHPDLCCPSELRIGMLCQVLYGVVELTTARDSDDVDWRPTGLAKVRSIVDDLMLAYCRRKGKSRWCDKSPANMEALGMLTWVFPDAQFIALHRNALDQAWSSYDVHGWEVRPGNQRSEMWTTLLERWCTVTERLLALERFAPSSVHRVTYESFVANPEREAGLIFQFLGLPRVAGLTVQAFGVAHDAGPADVKIRGSRAIEASQIGKGRLVDIGSVPASARNRAERLMGLLGYGSLCAGPDNQERVS